MYPKNNIMRHSYYLEWFHFPTPTLFCQSAITSSNKFNFFLHFHYIIRYYTVINILSYIFQHVLIFTSHPAHIRSGHPRHFLYSYSFTPFTLVVYILFFYVNVNVLVNVHFNTVTSTTYCIPHPSPLFISTPIFLHAINHNDLYFYSNKLLNNYYIYILTSTFL